MLKIFLITSVFCFSLIATRAQQTSSEIFVQVQKLASLKRVLYIAAHPDDENTRALAWFSLDQKAETAYLSLTRGDGGQNLIGNELGANLGLLRSQELLKARSIDGSRQFFSRAVDFGYSRSATESFDKWNKDAVLEDVVTIIRQFKPDVIIARFPPDERAGHGHHTASSIIAKEAFEKAADVNFLPNQVKDLGAWKTTSLYWNASNWWNKGLDTIAVNNPNYLIFDIGEYNSLLGRSYNEIGTLARSQHKCQGFGSVIERGSRIEYFEYMAGSKLKASFFESSQRTWENMVNKKIQQLFNKLITQFDFKNTSNNVPILVQIFGQLQLLQDNYLKDEKAALCQHIIAQCLGLHIAVLADDFSYISDTDLTLNLQIVNRSQRKVTLESIVDNKFFEIQYNNTSQVLTNTMFSDTFSYKSTLPTYQPYWLENEYENLYQLSNSSYLGMPQSPSGMLFNVMLNIENTIFSFPVPATYKWGDPSYGERERDVISVPKFSVNFDEEVVLSPINTVKNIKVKVHSFSNQLSDSLVILAPIGWSVSPSVIAINDLNKHQSQWVDFDIKPTEDAINGKLIITDSKGKVLKSFQEIAYDHIPTQVLFDEAKLPLKKLEVAIKKGKIGYIKGVTEGVPAAIARMGFEVTLIDVNELPTINLSQFQSVVIGIRAFNVLPQLISYNQILNEYIEKGGNLIVQYNTATSDVKKMQMGPFPFQIGRERVTEEDAKVTLLKPEHHFFNIPNKISWNDFDNWVQERGLYFAEKFNEPFVPLISWHDTDKIPAIGGLIVARYGKGQVVYTGISFFRQLPSGVEGAYKLFANMLSYTYE